MSAICVSAEKRLDDVRWPRVLNWVITRRWVLLKSSLVLKDFIDYLIQKRVVTLDYWMGLKSRPVSESERTEDFLSLVMKFDQQKYNHFLEALLTINRHDLVENLIAAQKYEHKDREHRERDGADEKESSKFAKGATVKKPKSGKKEPWVKTYEAPKSPSKSQADNKKTKTAKTQKTKEKDTAQLPEIDKNVVPDKAGQDRRTEAVDNANGNSVSVPNTENSALIVNAKRLSQEQASTDHKEQTSTKLMTEQRDTKEKDVDETNLQPVTGKTKEDVLNEKEMQLKAKEAELQLKEEMLQQKEISLTEKENKLNTRENTFMMENSDLQNNATSTDVTITATSEILADVREQLKAMRKVKDEIVSEHTTCCSTPKEEFVKIEEFKSLQLEIDEIREEFLKDRQAKTVVQRKVEDMKDEIEHLKRKISEMSNDNAQNEAKANTEIEQLKKDLKQAGHDHDVMMKKLESEIKTRQQEKLKNDLAIEELTKYTNDLEKRVAILEQDKQAYINELQKYEKDINELRETLEAKENDLNDLRNVLEDTENEKEELIDMLNNLKSEVDKLKADRKKLESEKKVLLARCVKPQWNQSTAGTTRRTTFR